MIGPHDSRHDGNAPYVGLGGVDRVRDAPAIGGDGNRIGAQAGRHALRLAPDMTGTGQPDRIHVPRSVSIRYIKQKRARSREHRAVIEGSLGQYHRLAASRREEQDPGRRQVAERRSRKHGNPVLRDAGNPLPSPDQVQEWRIGPEPTNRLEPPDTATISSESFPRTNAISSPSGDQVAPLTSSVDEAGNDHAG